MDVWYGCTEDVWCISSDMLLGGGRDMMYVGLRFCGGDEIDDDETMRWMNSNGDE